jgi:hypothetical protein
MLLRYHLNPRMIIQKERINRAAFEWITTEITRRFFEALVSPGEMVGAIAAQSIGEPSTQMSCVKSTIVTITDGYRMFYRGPIGEFIDNIMAKNATQLVEIAENSTVLDFVFNKYYIVGVSDTEQTSWRRITQVSRHPANGGLVKVTTRSGKTTTATLSHSFLRRAETGIVPVLGSELAIGMRIPVASHIEESPINLTSVPV